MRNGSIGAAIAFAAVSSTKACAADVPPIISASARETLDSWDNLKGGVRAGPVLLNKLQVSGTVAFDQLGAPGLSLHAQTFRTDGESLSNRVGDIQTLDSIDTAPVTRLFEAWVEKTFGGNAPSVSLRAGLLDLNADFDSIQTASLFVNSSHGIGADLARSGKNGPSIYPVSSLGARVSWTPSKAWAFRLGIFDGVPGDPDHPRTFVAARLAPADGVLLIGQADYHISDQAKVEGGLWRYTARLPKIDGSGSRRSEGAYASIEGPILGVRKLSAWCRVGVANRDVQAVEAYAGAGLVFEAPFSARPNDRVGLAIAHAAIGRPSRSALQLPAAETSVEATYQMKLRETVAIQPDLQYVIAPAGLPHARNAVVAGLRIVLTAGYPKKAPAADSSDPTIPPEGPQPSDDGAPK